MREPTPFLFILYSDHLGALSVYENGSRAVAFDKRHIPIISAVRIYGIGYESHIYLASERITAFYAFEFVFHCGKRGIKRMIRVDVAFLGNRALYRD